MASKITTRFGCPADLSAYLMLMLASFLADLLSFATFLATFFGTTFFKGRFFIVVDFALANRFL